MKVCKKCGTILDNSEFYKNSKAKDKLSNICNENNVKNKSIDYSLYIKYNILDLLPEKFGDKYNDI